MEEILGSLAAQPVDPGGLFEEDGGCFRRGILPWSSWIVVQWSFLGPPVVGGRLDTCVRDTQPDRVCRCGTALLDFHQTGLNKMKPSNHLLHQNRRPALPIRKRMIDRALDSLPKPVASGGR